MRDCRNRRVEEDDAGQGELVLEIDIDRKKKPAGRQYRFIWM